MTAFHALTDLNGFTIFIQEFVALEGGDDMPSRLSILQGFTLDHFVHGQLYIVLAHVWHRAGSLFRIKRGTYNLPIIIITID